MKLIISGLVEQMRCYNLKNVLVVYVHKKFLIDIIDTKLSHDYVSRCHKYFLVAFSNVWCSAGFGIAPSINMVWALYVLLCLREKDDSITNVYLNQWE